MGSGACSLDPFLRTLPSKQSKLLLFAIYILIMVGTELCMLMQSFVLLYDIFMGITSKIFCSGYGLLFLQYLNTSTIRPLFVIICIRDLKKKLTISYPCVMLNVDVARNNTNDQYQVSLDLLLFLYI